MNKKTFLLIPILFLAISCNNQPAPANIQISYEHQETANPEQKEIHPVSLQALMQKEFDGRDLTLGQVLNDNLAYTRYYITYKSGELTISGIMNVPKGDVPKGGFPVLILNHGYIDPSVYTNGRGLKREQDYLARQGFVIIHPDYRNHAQSSEDPDVELSIRLDYVEDVINAVMAVKESTLDYLNKEQIGMLGHSMGGGITQNVLVVKPELIKAAILYAPVSMDARDSFNRWTRSRGETAEKIVELYGSPTTTPEFWDNISAVNFIKNIKAPMLYFHGDQDADVPVEWSRDALKLLTNAKIDAKLIEYPGQPHEFIPPSWTNFMEQSTEFFKKNL